MPIYEFECPNGHKFEIVRVSAFDFGTTFKCTCGAIGDRIWSLPANINIGKPTIIFRNASDPTDVQVASHSEAQVPYGFVKEELHNPIERSKFEKERQKILDAKNELITESVKLRDEATRKARHDDINSRMSSLPDDGTRDLMKFAMERSRKKKEKVKKSNVRLDVNHIDSSNLVK